MKNEIIQSLISVINALNNIEVKGKNNLMNLGGCIAVIEEVYQKISVESEGVETECTKEVK